MGYHLDQNFAIYYVCGIRANAHWTSEFCVKLLATGGESGPRGSSRFPVLKFLFRSRYLRQSLDLERREPEESIWQTIGRGQPVRPTQHGVSN